MVAGLVLRILGALHGDFTHLRLAQVPPSAWVRFFYLLLVGSLGGYPVYLWLMRSCAPSKVATIPYINLLVAVFLGWTLGHEIVTPRLLAGTAIVLASVAIVLRAKEKSHAGPDDSLSLPPSLTEEQLPMSALRENEGRAKTRS